MLNDIPHGTYSRYNNRKCRCDECKAAMREYHRRRYADDPSKYTKYGSAWKANNPDAARAIARRAKKRYYANNRDALIEDAIKWNRENLERRREIAARYKRNNPQAVALDNERRRAHREAIDTFILSVRDWTRLCRRYGNRCAYCHVDGRLTMDHVVPISRGGSHGIGNLLPACQSCNSSKGDRLLVEWRRALLT